MSKLQVNGWEARPRRTSGGGRYYRVYHGGAETHYDIDRRLFGDCRWIISHISRRVQGGGHGTIREALEFLARN